MPLFAGIGVWSNSLRLAGWPDDKPVWTGSCPCQPFSAAGKGDGFADERHLWPHFFHLISERRPQHVFGEQVAAGNANAWFDLVQTMGYAFGLTPFPSAGIGAPHIRERAYWVAESTGEQCQKLLPGLAQGIGAEGSRSPAKSTGLCSVSSLDNSDKPGLERHFRNDCAAGRERQAGPTASPGVHDRMVNANNKQHAIAISGCGNEYVSTGRQQDPAAIAGLRRDCRPLEVNGFWRDADWLFYGGKLWPVTGSKCVQICTRTLKLSAWRPH